MVFYFKKKVIGYLQFNFLILIDSNSVYFSFHYFAFDTYLPL